jgi:hypothetical protein
MKAKVPEKLVRIEKEFARIGLLLQHDRDLPSFTTLVVGRPVAGSWWGHRRGREIYRLLEEFQLRSGKLSAKLVNGKLTYVHKRLWPAFLELATHGERTRARRLSPLAKKLYKKVRDDDLVRVDELVTGEFADTRTLAAAARELEESILVHGDSVHTASGAHAKVLRSWTGWAATHGIVRPAAYTLGRARLDFGEALHRLQEGSTRPLTLPLPVERHR